MSLLGFIFFLSFVAIQISIAYYRPVTVFVQGEVRKPGLYTLFYEEGSNSIEYPGIDSGLPGFMPSEGDPIMPIKNYTSPKLFDVLKLSSGITNYADISNIQIIRNNSLSQGGGKIKANINFLSLFIDGDQSTNIRLMDGDTIFIPKSPKMLKDQVLSVTQTNLMPDQITVYISGNVNFPGFVPHHKTIDYSKLTTFLIGAIQEQQKQIDELKKKLEEL